MKSTVSFLGALLLIPLTTGSPQSAGDDRAFAALSASHIGALTPVMSSAMIGRRLNSAQLGLRYGLQDADDVRQQAVAGVASFAAGENSTLSVVAGVADGDCAGCSPAMLLGIGGDMRLIEMGDLAGGGSSLNVGLSGDVGYAQIKPGDNSALALGIGAPVTLSLSGGGMTGMRFVPYFTPVFGIGQVNGSCGTAPCERSGIRLVVGGGIGVWNPLTNVSASVGINRVVHEGSSPVFGINVAFGGR